MKHRKSDRIHCEQLTFYVVEGNGFTTLVEAQIADLPRSWERKNVPEFTHRYLIGCGTVKEIHVLGVRRVQEKATRQKHCRRVALPPAPDIGDTCELLPFGVLYEFGWQGDCYAWAVVG